MPGMGRSLGSGNSFIVSHFHSALYHQVLFVLVVAGLLAVAFNVVRTIQYRHLGTDGVISRGVRGWATTEPPARRVLRIGFGLLWIVDGLLQLQSAMPLGLPPSVVEPAASGSPTWVQELVNSGVTIWSNHPIQAAAATVWLQVGLGIWLLVAPRGRWLQVGGAASAGWALVVWMFGEAFGGIFNPGATWLFGTPGSALLYGAAGLLLALPERRFATARLGRIVLAAGGVFFLGMALLQAWPGRGFWQGHGASHQRVGTLVTMVRAMAGTSQPGWLSSWVAWFARFDAAHGWAVNLVAVVALAGIGLAFLSGRRRLVSSAVVAMVLLCLADWVLVQDLGVFGGVGTDPNSMVPLIVLFVAAYVGTVRLPVAAPADAETLGSAEVRSAPNWWERATPGSIFRVVATLGAVVLVGLGTAPMAVAAANPNADPILTEALDGAPNPVSFPAPSFRLTDQRGEPVSLAGFRGHAVALTFLDPVCTSDCPTIAQEFRAADDRLGKEARQVDFVAIVANPIYRSRVFTKAFDRQEYLTGVTNWYFLTGSEDALRRAWNEYGVLVAAVPGGAMVAHSDLAFVIDARGRERDALVDDPGPTETFASSFSSLLVDRINEALHP
jgi:cytochrome oxidase Cu insertion factor (SCO1/SenC/PrrC family)